MGSASCKNSKSSEKTEKTDDIKHITIGVFGLDHAGKTSAVKAIEGKPTDDVVPTMSAITSMVPNPITAKGDNKNQDRIEIIDVSGMKNFREKSWSNYYEQIHGLIFVIDASEKKRIMENIEILNKLLKDAGLKDKPILILANKQDRKGAIDDEDDIKEKFQLAKLKTEHKIELCTALPQRNNKADESIRHGFIWLIKAIDTDYSKLNSRVKNARQSKPVDKKTPINNKQKLAKSDQSDSDGSDNDIVYSKKRATSPINKTKDYRSTNFSTKLPSLDTNKNKPKPTRNGHDTHSEDDDDDNRPYSRPNIQHRPDLSSNDRNHSLNQSLPSAANSFNKKKKVIGAPGSNNNDTPIKKPNDNDPKSFRASYERFPEDAPWSSSINKTTKTDDIIPKAYGKPLISNDPTKRNMSPLVHDTKPYGSGSITKRTKGSDDDEDDYGSFNQKPKPTSTLPSLNRSHDINKYDDHKYTSSLSTNKTSSVIKKPTAGIYGGIDEDDDYNKSSNSTYRRPNVTVPTTTPTKKSYNDDDDDYFPNKPTPKTTKSYDSDDDNNYNKNNPRSSDRLNPYNNDYKGVTSKPPPSPSTRSKFNGDNFSSSTTKPAAHSKFDNDDDDFPSSSKPINRSKYDNDDRLSSSSKLTTGSKYDDRPLSSSKISTRPKYDDDDDSPLSTSKVAGRSKYTDDYPASSLKPIIRSKYNENERSASPKPVPHSRFDDDDDDRPSFGSKIPARPKYNDDDHSFSPSKATSHSKFDDDDDRPSYSSKTPARPKYNDDDHSFSPSKTASHSKFDDDDDHPSYPSKTPARTKFNDDNRSFSPSKTAPHSKFDDDDDRPSYSSKTPARTKYNDDDRSFSPSKATSHSKFDDDDDYPSSPLKKNTDSSRYGDFDSPKGGSYNARAISASARRPRTDMDDDN